MQDYDFYAVFCDISDQALLTLYKDGNQHAMTALIARYAALINKRASNYYIAGVENEDIKQEAYMGLFNAIRTYDKNKNASFYTYANLCIDNRLKNMFVAASTNKAKFNNSNISLDDIKDYNIQNKDTLSPETIYIETEDYNILLNLAEQNLSSFERDVLFLYLNGCNYQTIAIKLNSSQKSVDNALQRARRKLKKVLNRL